ncbi:winged helix-turn-helix domain-containing protein [Vibrio sp.]|uniref:transcriptional regulator n=1 Tax=Vibrio sp. TaxID=678 RepID=UPI00311DED6A
MDKILKDSPYAWALVPLARHQLVNIGTQKAKKLKGPECKVLEVLINHTGEVVAKDTIITEAWAGKVVTDASLTQSIAQLRLALGDSGKEQKCIKTIPNEGYLLFDNVVTLCEQSPEYRENEQLFSRVIPSTESTHKETGDSAVLSENQHQGSKKKPVQYIDSSDRFFKEQVTLSRFNAHFIKVLAVFFMCLAFVQTWHLALVLTKSQQIDLVEWNETVDGGIHYKYVKNSQASSLFNFMTENMTLSKNFVVERVFISSNLNHYYIACVHQSKNGRGVRVKNLYFDAQESFETIGDRVNEYCQ